LTLQIATAYSEIRRLGFAKTGMLQTVEFSSSEAKADHSMLRTLIIGFGLTAGNTSGATQKVTVEQALTQ
jgi:hypothetical protein